MTKHPDYWNRIYEDEGRPGWDMAGATPLVRELLDLARPLGLQAGGDLVVPGCGYGHDAAELAAEGFRVTGLDFAPLAIQGATERYGAKVAWHQDDWFTTALGPWDAIFDHTCFVAMDPVRRPDYVKACAAHLRPGGLWMAALFHEVKGPAGPPHAISMPEMRALAEAHFDVLHLAEATASHPRRAGREFLMVARRR
ncbi:SAM-dependent methyltransferase [Geothrix limicola]|uniref:SAM-dependent methyltransferase n=1 Tax=Geothrix limicola TaxID=2927978 RepID=A0ABQ5QE04_9BACT|nr:methyltransferase domain-containing protein [Geothrix limicola]GLH72721.1 SAM-dependent methyltransferase [Geothrix limicola]